MSTKSNSAAQLYATAKAPYLQYLQAIENEWQEAKVLARHLETATQCIPTITDECILEGESTPIAHLFDISSSSDAEGNTRNTATVTGKLGRHLVRPVPSTVEHFCQQLRSCKPDVHTRIVILHRQWGCPDQDRAGDTLLFCHILGMELDLRPSDVSILARIDDFKEEVGSPRRHPQLPGFVSLGSMEDCQSNSIATLLGVRAFHSGSANLVVMCLQERRFPWDGTSYSRFDTLLEPPLPSLWMPGWKRSSRSAAQGIYGRALDHNLRSVPAVQADIPDGIWLAAMIDLEVANCAGWFDKIASQRFKICDDTDPSEQQKLSTQISNLCKTLQSDISQVVAFQRTPSVHVRSTDYEGALLMLERLLGEAKMAAADVRESLDAQHRTKNTQVAELAINESRSAIAVTVLAFVFIPINLASSLYGMNVQEINRTGHSIWGFLVTASVLLTLSGLAWMGWRASRNWNLMLDETGRALPATHRPGWLASPLYWRMSYASERFRKRDFAVYVGLRSVEKRKNSAV